MWAIILANFSSRYTGPASSDHPGLHETQDLQQTPSVCIPKLNQMQNIIELVILCLRESHLHTLMLFVVLAASPLSSRGFAPKGN